MKSTLFFGAALLSTLLTLPACHQEMAFPQPSLPYRSIFQQDSNGWVTDIVDYGTAQDTIMAFESAPTALPAPLDVNH